MAYAVPAEEKHVAELLDIGLRAEDAEEIYAYGGLLSRCCTSPSTTPHLHGRLWTTGTV